VLTNQAIYHHIFENLNGALFVTDARTGMIIDTNRQGEVLIGRTREEIIGMHHTALHPPEKEEHYQKVLSSYSDQRGAAQYDGEVVSENGEIIPVTIRDTIVHLNGDRLILGLFIDVSEQKKTADELWETEERFRQLSEASFEGISISTFGKGLILDANRAFAAIMGYDDLSEVIGEDSWRFMAPESIEVVVNNVIREYDKPYEAVCVRKDGSNFVAEMCSKVTYYHGQKAVVAAVRDITERKILDDKLRESEEKLRVMFDSSGEGFIIYEPDGCITQLNNATVDLFGYDSKKEFIGRYIIDLFISKHRRRAEVNMSKAFKRRSAHKAEYSCLRRNGEVFDAELSIAPLRVNGERPAGFVAIVRDITESKRFRANMQYYISQITRVQEEERRRVARELHDETLQSLVSLSFDIDTMIIGNGHLSPKDVQQLQRLRDKTHNIMDEVRRFSHNLRPDVIDRMGLVPTLEILIDEMNRGEIIRAHIEVIGTERRLTSEAELVLFRIAQEALRNTIKHSQATDASVIIVYNADKVKLVIADNGKGFEVPGMLVDLASKGKLGLIGMLERVRLLDGILSIESKPLQGTKVIVEIGV